MLNYCDHCDEVTEFTHTVGDPEYATPKPKWSWLWGWERGERFCRHDSRGDDWYKCQKCGMGTNRLPVAPPQERVFNARCNHGGRKDVITTFTWVETWDKHSVWFQCSECGAKFSLPNDKKKRDAYIKWQANGCRPPWWFRPTQLGVLLFIIVMCFLQPFWMFISYLVFCYLFAAAVIFEDVWREGLVASLPGKLFGFMLAPIFVPPTILFYAFRLPIL